MKDEWDEVKLQHPTEIISDQYLYLKNTLSHLRKSL